MKRLFLLLSLLFCGFAYADTINLHWKNYDGTTYQDSTCVVDSDLILPSTPPTIYGYTFTGWKIANYIPIEYIQSTGTQYIDTGVKQGNSDTYATELKYKFVENPSTSGGGASLCGTWRNGYSSWGQLYTMNDATSLWASNPNTQVSGSVTTQRNTIYTDKFEINVINGSVTRIRNNITYTSSGFVFSPAFPDNVFLFAYNDGNNRPGQLSNAVLYSAKVWLNDTLVRDMIPVLDNDGVPCMFDKVTQQFFYNQGTGQFIAGPVLQQ